MNTCFSCSAPTSNPKFCSRSCSVVFNNTKSPKRKRAMRKDCRRCSLLCPTSRHVYCGEVCRQADIASAVGARLQDGTASPRTLKRAKIRETGIICSVCLLTEWMGKPIPLVLDHIDGHSENNDWDNLRLVCGNCDMQLDTYKSKNKGNGRYNRRKRYAAGLSY
jgi:hypothetical protein